jgi:hypothetical protein
MRATTAADRPRDERKAPPSDDRRRQPNECATVPLSRARDRILRCLLTNQRPITCRQIWNADFRATLTGCKSVN